MEEKELSMLCESTEDFKTDIQQKILVEANFFESILTVGELFLTMNKKD